MSHHYSASVRSSGNSTTESDASPITSSRRTVGLSSLQEEKEEHKDHKARMMMTIMTKMEPRARTKQETKE